MEFIKIFGVVLCFILGVVLLVCGLFTGMLWLFSNLGFWSIVICLILSFSFLCKQRLGKNMKILTNKQIKKLNYQIHNCMFSVANKVYEKYNSDETGAVRDQTKELIKIVDDVYDTQFDPRVSKIIINRD